MNATHEDWLNIREKRDAEARRAVRDLLDGNESAALAHAKKWDEYDDELLRIARAIDGRADK